MLMPKRVKHRKVQRGRRSGASKGCTKVDFGEFGLKAMGDGWVTARQIEAARIALTRHVKRGGKIRIRIERRAIHDLGLSEPVGKEERGSRLRCPRGGPVQRGERGRGPGKQGHDGKRDKQKTERKKSEMSGFILGTLQYMKTYSIVLDSSSPRLR